MTTTPFPKHGTRSRTRLFGCTCVACTSRCGPVADDYVVRWPWYALQRRIGIAELREWFDEEQIDIWRSNGLSDEEADMAAVHFGLHPFQVWKGWVEAGLDYAETATVKDPQSEVSDAVE